MSNKAFEPKDRPVTSNMVNPTMPPAPEPMINNESVSDNLIPAPNKYILFFQNLLILALFTLFLFTGTKVADLYNRVDDLEARIDDLKLEVQGKR